MHNSATFVVSNGRHVPAISGMRIVLLHAQIKSSSARSHDLLPTTPFGWNWFKKQSISCEDATIAPIGIGDMSEENTNVKSASIAYRSTSSSADSVAFELAIDAGGIGCEDCSHHVAQPPVELANKSQCPKLPPSHLTCT